MTEPLLSVDDLHVYFRGQGGDVKAVDGISFELAKGEVLGIVGESGSGKSVANLAVMGLIPQPPGFFPAGGVHFGGRDLLKSDERALRSIRGNRISMIFQDPMTSLNPYLRVERQLTEVLELHKKLSRREARRRAVEMLERVGIPQPDLRIDSYPHEFSGGMRQRVMIAMALLCEPDLLIADEPTTALDVTIQAQILELIRDLQREAGTGVILITHDMGVVASIADRVAVMYAGRIVEAAPVRDLFADPQHPYTVGLLGSIPRLDARGHEPLRPIDGLPPDLSDLPDGCAFRARCERALPECAVDYPERQQLGPDRYAHCFAVKR